MKIESKFSVENNKLYRIADKTEVSLASPMQTSVAMICGKELESGAKMKMISELTATHDKVLCVHVPWLLVEAEPEIYNEELLASLRDFLKEIEKSGLYAIIVPESDADSCPVPLLCYNKINSDSAQLFIAAMKHTARRIKDCESVVGFAVPKELFADTSAAADYMSELSLKHDNYLFFVKKTEVENSCAFADIAKTGIVLY